MITTETYRVSLELKALFEKDTILSLTSPVALPRNARMDPSRFDVEVPARAASSAAWPKQCWKRGQLEEKLQVV